MAASDIPWEDTTWQKPARITKRRVGLVLLFLALVAVFVAVYLKVTEKHARLTAVDRSTGAERWRDTLPEPGAAAIVQQGNALGISACADGEGGGWLVVDPSTGTVHERDWRPADGDPALVSVWIDPPTIQFPTAVPEFSYDRATGSLVSAKGWTVKVHVSGFPRQIPILVVGDTVYFIENATGCAPGREGGGD